MQQAASTREQRFLLQWDPNIRWIAFQRFAEKSRGSDSNHRKRVPLDNERRTHHRRIARIGRLPHAMAEHHHRRRPRPVVLRRKNASAERTHSQRREVAPGHVFRSQRLGHRVDALPPHAHPPAPRLKRRNLFKFRCFCLQPLVQSERKHSPFVLRTPFHAAIVSFANPVESPRIGNRQRPQHHRMDQREDCRGSADSQGQRQYRRCSEYRRQTELS